MLIENCTIRGNKARLFQDGPDYWMYGGSGAGIYLSDSDAVINDTIVEENLAVRGGGIEFFSSNIVINRGIIKNNTAQTSGSS